MSRILSEICYNLVKPPKEIAAITYAENRSVDLTVGLTNDNWEELEVELEGEQTGRKYSESFQCLDYITGGSNDTSINTTVQSQCQLDPGV